MLFYFFFFLIFIKFALSKIPKRLRNVNISLAMCELHYKRQLFHDKKNIKLFERKKNNDRKLKKYMFKNHLVIANFRMLKRLKE